MNTANVNPVHLLVDLENLQPEPDQIRAFLLQPGSVWIFHDAKQKKLLPPLKALGDEVTLVPTVRPGKNSLDFHLIFYLGYLASRNNHCRFVVLSKDKGYDPAIEHARILGLDVVRVKKLPGAKGGERVAKAAPVKKTASNAKSAPSKDASAKKPAKTAAVKTAKKSAAASSSEKRAGPTERLVAYLQKHSKNRPTTLKRLERHIPSIVGGKVNADIGPRLIAELVQRGQMKLDGDKIEYTLSKKK